MFNSDWSCCRETWTTTMVTASFINRLSHAVDVIENRSQQGRPLKIVTVRRGYDENPEHARDRHFKAHPEDLGADIIIFEFCGDTEMTSESQDCTASPKP